MRFEPQTLFRLQLALFLSLLTHAVLGFLLYQSPMKQQTEVVEIDYLPPPTSGTSKPPPAKKMQIVEQDEVQANDLVDEKAKYLGRHNQKILTETKAAQHGDFSNTAGQMGDSNRPTPKPRAQKQKNSDTKAPSLADLKPKFDFSPKLEDLHPTAAGTPGGPSQQNDHIKDVQTGIQTMLSTREFIYHSYYSRIKSQLRHHWEPRIKDKFMNMIRQGRQIASQQTRITKVVITLDQAGTLIKVQVLDESGIRDLDDAAVEAFKAAAPFPNPPKGIVDEDGTIKIRWDFVLEA